MAQGCADYPQNISCTLKDGVPLRNLADDGRDVKASQSITKRGGKSPHYGAIRNLTRYKSPAKTWNATITPGKLSADIPGIAPRAAQGFPHAGFRLHWLEPADATVYIGEAPRHRFYMERDNAAKMRYNWTKNLMPKIVVRREGENLNSRFVALWEPFPGKVWINKVETIGKVPEHDGNAIRISAEDCDAVVLFRASDSSSEISAEDYRSSANVAVSRRIGDTMFLDITGGGTFSTGNITLKASDWPRLRAVRTGTYDSEDYVVVSGDLSLYPAETAQQPHAGKWVIFRQQGQPAWWLPVRRIEKNDGNEARIIFSREIGFEFDGANRLLTEKFFNYKLFFGDAEVILPVNTSVSFDGNQINCHISSDVELTLLPGKDLILPSGVTRRDSANESTLNIPLTATQNGQVSIRLKPSAGN
ncbi:MAG: hypothetical protein JXR78_18255 [Victivallales bacterium]|nr:hypothetical protein [Victivallales bacterium]